MSFSKDFDSDFVEKEHPSKASSLQLDDDNSPSYYELTASDEHLVENLSDKMKKIPKPNITMTKSYNAKQPTSMLVFNSEDDHDNHITESRRVNNGDESPNSRAEYDRRSMDESYARGKIRYPKGSPKKRANRLPFCYNTHSTEDTLLNKDADSKGRGSPTNDLNEITPSTKAESLFRSNNSCYSCQDPYLMDNEEVPVIKGKHKQIKTKSRIILYYLFIELETYLQKAKGLEAKTYSPVIMRDSSNLECIDEEGSHEEKLSSEDHSALTAEPHHISKEDYYNALQRSHTANDGARKYSILAKRVSNDDFLDITEKRKTSIKKRGTESSQPKQQLLSINKGVSSKSTSLLSKSCNFLKLTVPIGLRRFDKNKVMGQEGKFCQVNDEYDECASLMCWKKK